MTALLPPTSSRAPHAARRLAWRLAALLGAALAATAARGADVQVAVAANFVAPMQELAAAFERESGHHAVIVGGATGKLYAQIHNGAPFEILLAADAATPRKLEEEGLAVPGRGFTYAVGRLVLYSTDPGLLGDGATVLRAGRFEHLAIANPRVAPYGAAALQALRALGLESALQERLVQGESIAQAYEFVASGNAQLGFVALSQVQAPGRPAAGSWWLVPPEMDGPIRQDAALLRAGAQRPAAAALLDFLRSEKARAIIGAWGYGL